MVKIVELSVADPGILQGGVQGPRKGRSVGIFKLPSKNRGGGVNPLTPLDPPLPLEKKPSFNVLGNSCQVEHGNY